VPPVRKPLRLAYQLIGFKRTEQLVRLWAMLCTPPPRGPAG
jgi:hypothetical protein